HDFKEGLGIDQGVVDLVIDPVQLPDGTGHIAEKHNVEHDGPNAHGPVQHEIGGEDDHHHHPDLFQHGFHAIEHKARMPGLHLVLGHVELDLSVLGGFHGFPGKGLYDRDGVDDAYDGIAFGLPLCPERSTKTAQFLGLKVADIKIDRDNAQADQADPYIGVEHGDQGQKGIGEQGKDIDKKVSYQSG